MTSETDGPTARGGMSGTETPPGAPSWRLVTGVLVVAVVWNLVGNLWLPGALYVPANLAVAGVVIAMARREGMSWPELALARENVGRGLAIGLGAVAAIGTAVGLALVVASAVPAVEGFFEDDAVAGDGPVERWFVPLLRIPLGTAVFEELLFRSVLLGALLLMTRTRRALVLSSLLFGLWHVVPAWETADSGPAGTVGVVLGTVAFTSVAGFALGLLRTASRSVVAPILAHAAANSFVYLAAVIAVEWLD